MAKEAEEVRRFIDNSKERFKEETEDIRDLIKDLNSDLTKKRLII